MSAPTAERPHGRAKYVVEKCKCDICRAANRAYANHLKRQRLYGHQADLVDAGSAREHVRTLMASGMGSRRIAEKAGLHRSMIMKLLNGAHTRNMVPSKRIRSDSARKILAVTLDVAAGALVDATGSRRRLQALVALGYPKSRLAVALGQTPSNFGMMMERPCLVAATASDIRALYDRLSLIPAKPKSARDRGVINRTRKYAQVRGWAPPLAWDDDTIDDPAAAPEGVRPVKVRGHARKLPCAEDIRFLLANGSTVGLIAVKYGVTEPWVRTALEREA